MSLKVWKLGLASVNNLPVFIELLVPAEVARVTQHKCDIKHHWECRIMKKSRVASAIVLSIVDSDGNTYDKATGYYNYFEYNVGRMAIPDMYDPDPTVCCGHGIHVHKTKDDCLVHEEIAFYRRNTGIFEEEGCTTRQQLQQKCQEIRDRLGKQIKEQQQTSSMYERNVLALIQEAAQKVYAQPLDYSASKKKKAKH